ncbi:MAG: 1-phosphofructokinase family hexose kinase [Anaerolineae bacterium]|nr:1-phosphofructokinase family hexose kinase [Anaerolineae bacterium]
MIVCVTPNPALDLSLVVTGFQTGQVFRAESSLRAAGGKGINVARATKLLGGDATCAGFIGGHTGRLIVELAEREGLKSSWTWIEGETRTCVIIADPHTGQPTVINDQGPRVTEEDWKRLHTHVQYAANSANAVCFSGSLPPKPPLDSFVSLLEKLVKAQKQVWVDTSGKPLVAACAIKGVTIKANDEEIAEVAGQPIDTPESAYAAAQHIRKRGPSRVVVTMGAQGAVLADERGGWYAAPPHLEVISAVGSGDSFLAGMVNAFENGSSPADALAQGVAAGAANALTVGGGQFALADYRRILGQIHVSSLSG